MNRKNGSRLGAAALLTALLGSTALATPAFAETQPSAAVSETAPAGKLMLVMDASGSMGERLAGSDGTKIAAARSALHGLVGALPAEQPVGLRVFGATKSKSSGAACTDSQRVVDLGATNRDALDAAVDRVKPFGETPIGYALQQAGKDLGAAGQRTIVLVSDGEPTCAPDPCEVAAGLAGSGIAVRIDVVGLAVSGTARSKLRCIAERGQGDYYDADSAADLANALDQAAVRAATPIRTSGTRVSGTNTRVGAPLVQDGDWLDTLGGVGGDRQTLYYTVHRDRADSTMHVSIGTPLTTESDMIGVTLLDSEGGTCASDTGNGAAALDIDAFITASVSIPRSLDASDLHCAAAGDFVVQVDHGYHNSTATGRRADVPIELRVREEAPVQDVQSLPATVETPMYADPALTGTPVKTAGGDALAAATVLKAGTYSGTLATGDSQVFAVDLAYGQSLAAAVRMSVSPLLAQQLSTGGWPTLSVRLLSPSRLDAAGGFAFRSTANDHQRGFGTVYQGSDGRVVYDYTNTVNYRNRLGTSDELRGSSEAGRYLVVVSLLDRDGNARRNAVPFVMGIGVQGEASGGPVSVVEPSETPSTQPTGTATDERRVATGHHQQAVGPIDLVRQTAGFGVIALGVLVVLAGAIVLVVVVIRRAARS